MNDTGPPTHLHALDEFSDWAAAAPAAGLWRRSADFAEHFVDRELVRPLALRMTAVT